MDPIRVSRTNCVIQVPSGSNAMTQPDDRESEFTAAPLHGYSADPTASTCSRTSLSHPLRIDVVQAGDAGGLIGITFCPGKGAAAWTASSGNAT